MIKKAFTIYAGVNGAGKSTLYKTYGVNFNEIRINTDEIVQNIGHWSNVKDQMMAGKIAVKMIEDCIKQGKSFNQETTLSGKSIINNIKKAKENGFAIYLNYVGLGSVELAKKRVKQRVSEGGHDIDSKLIEKRYYDSLENLKKILPLCDNIQIYDNTKRFRLVLDIENGILKHKVNIKWLEPVISEYLDKKDRETSMSMNDWKTEIESAKKEKQRDDVKSEKRHERESSR